MHRFNFFIQASRFGICLLNFLFEWKQFAQFLFVSSSLLDRQSYMANAASLIDRAIWRMRPRDSIPSSGAAARYDFSSYDNQFRIVTELIFYQGVADHPCLAHFFSPSFLRISCTVSIIAKIFFLVSSVLDLFSSFKIWLDGLGRWGYPRILGQLLR